MRYGQPKLFAIQAVRKYIAAQFRQALKWPRMVSLWLFKTVFLVGFFGLSVTLLWQLPTASNTSYLGHYAQIETEMVTLPDGKPRLYSRGEELFGGHRCARLELVRPREIRFDRIDGGALSHRTACVGKATGQVYCCTAIASDSDKEWEAYLRAFFLRFRYVVYVPMLGLFLTLTLAMVLALAVSVALIGASAAIFTPYLVLRTAGASALALSRLTWVFTRTVRQLRVAPWIPPKLGDSSFTIAHLSDLHISPDTPYELLVDPIEYVGDVVDVSAGALRERVRLTLAHAVSQNPAAIALTGDLTDTGSAEEWRIFVEVINDATANRDHRPAVVAIPGNHDVNLNVGESPDVSGAAKRRREELAGEHLARVQTVGCNAQGTRVLFPNSTVFAIDGVRVNIVSLDSCRYKSRFILSDSIGRLGEDQLNWLGNQLGGMTGPLVVLMHHHLALPSGRVTWRRPIVAAMELLKLPVDVRPLVQLLLGYSRVGNAVLVLHGHQHEELRYEVRDSHGGSVQVSGLASSTLGGLSSASPQSRMRLDGKPRYARIGLSASAGWAVDLTMV